MKNKKYISSTIGMQAYHPQMFESKLVSVDFYSVDGGVLLVPCSARNGAQIDSIKQVTISSAEFNDRPDSNQEEFFWAIKKLGFVFEEFEQE